MKGAQEPRLKVLPRGVEHPRWDEVQQFVADLGVTLDPWQWMVLHAALLRNEGLWAAFSVAVCCPRQNGKNGILEIRELVGACILEERLQIHTAHLADTSNQAFARFEDLLDANEWLASRVKAVRRANGKEAIEFRNGCKIRFRTRTRGGGRGFSASPVYMDESMFLPEVSMASILPVVSAQPDPQVWYMGSAVDQLTMDEGVSFARVRERALAGQHERLAYFEWSLDADSPDDVDIERAGSAEAWAESNPAFGIRIQAESVQEELGSLAPRSFAVERLGVGDWPRTDGLETVIDLARWAELADPESRPLDPVFFAFDVNPARTRAAIAAAGKRADGVPHVEVIEARQGTSWLAERMVQVTGRNPYAMVYCDQVSPAASLIPQLAQAGVKVEAVTTPDHAEACGLFWDSVDQGKLRHLGSLELIAAIRGAAQRPLGDRWAWSRKNSSADITPLVAATLALWPVLTADPVAAPMFAFG